MHFQGSTPHAGSHNSQPSGGNPTVTGPLRQASVGIPAGGSAATIFAGAYKATVGSVGATLRELCYGERDLIVPVPLDLVPPAFHGAILAPWPNRIDAGRYEFAGQHYQAVINEPERNNASHGLACWLNWELIEISGSYELRGFVEPTGDRDTNPGAVAPVGAATPGTAAPAGAPTTGTAPKSTPIPTKPAESRMIWRVVVAAQEAYPSTLELLATFTLDATSGLTWQVTATNIGTKAAPYGIATHPYVRGGTGTVDDWKLELPASQILETTPDRLLPRALHDVTNFAGGAFDFRGGKALDRAKIDHAFTGLFANGRETAANTPGIGKPVGSEPTQTASCETSPTVNGTSATQESAQSDSHASDITQKRLASVRVTDVHGKGCKVSWDIDALPWAQVFTSDLGKPDFPDRIGLAVEAMTCPANAFNTGVGLIRLEPGSWYTATWNIAAIGVQ